MAEFTMIDPYGDAAFPMLHVPDKIVEVFERHLDSFDYQETDDFRHWFELKGTSDAGGDMYRTIDVPRGKADDLKEWRKATYHLWDDFDPFYEAMLWCDNLGIPQRTPFDNGSDLFRDLDAYKNDVLKAIYDDMMALTEV